MNLLVSIVIGLAFLSSAAVALPSLIVEVARRSSPEVVFSVSTEEQVLGLSIDDGPSSATPEILEALEEHGVRATFFLIGSHIQERPELGRRIVDAGHEVGHHMMEDRPSVELSAEEFQRRFEEMDRILEDLDHGTRLFRPGSGWYDDEMLRTVERQGYRTVLGSVYPFDAHLSWEAFLSWFVLQTSGPGSVIVLHDGPERGLRTAEVLRTVLPELDRRGYRVVPVSELLSLGREAGGG